MTLFLVNVFLLKLLNLTLYTLNNLIDSITTKMGMKNFEIKCTVI